MLHAQASSSSQRRVLNIDPGSTGVVQLIRLFITGGYVSSYPAGGVYIRSGTVTFSSCTITGNTASQAGGVFVGSGSTVSLSSCNITGNTAPTGGGVDVWDGSTVSLSSCIITGSTAPRIGGDVYIHVVSGGMVTFSSCTITGNTANGGGYGGGVYISGGTV